MLEKEDQLKAQLVVIHQKDSEISRFMGKLRSYQPQSTTERILVSSY